METPKRPFNTVSPGTDSPMHLKIIKRSPSERIKEITDLINERIQPLEEQLSEATIERNDLKQQLGEVLEAMKNLKEENQELKEWNRGQDRHNRSWNLVFRGFTEMQGETPMDCKKRVIQTLQYAKIFLQPLSIEKAKRIGIKNHHNSRPIIVRFLHQGERNNILQRQNQIYTSCKISVEEDYPPHIEEARRELYPIMKAINTFEGNANHKYKANLFEDQLIVNGKVYTRETLHKLPTEISTERLFTRHNNKKTAFFSKHSPLSNYYKSKMTVYSNTYSCSEQHYTQQKALTFSDYATANKIMKETNPATMKKLGKNVKNYDHKTWKDKKVEVMRIGLQSKFRDPKLSTFLLNTGEDTLMEASPNDKFWGVGLSMDNPRIWNTNNWWGRAENKMGSLLSEIRQEIRRETHSKIE